MYSSHHYHAHSSSRHSSRHTGPFDCLHPKIVAEVSGWIATMLFNFCPSHAYSFLIRSFRNSISSCYIDNYPHLLYRHLCFVYPDWVVWLKIRPISRWFMMFPVWLLLPIYLWVFPISGNLLVIKLSLSIYNTLSVIITRFSALLSR
jgi:hypothetical protein